MRIELHRKLQKLILEFINGLTKASFPNNNNGSLDVLINKNNWIKESKALSAKVLKEKVDLEKETFIKTISFIEKVFYSKPGELQFYQVWNELLDLKHTSYRFNFVIINYLFYSKDNKEWKNIVEKIFENKSNTFNNNIYFEPVFIQAYGFIINVCAFKDSLNNWIQKFIQYLNDSKKIFNTEDLIEKNYLEWEEEIEKEKINILEEKNDLLRHFDIFKTQLEDVVYLFQQFDKKEHFSEELQIIKSLNNYLEDTHNLIDIVFDFEFFKSYDHSYLSDYFENKTYKTKSLNLTLNRDLLEKIQIIKFDFHKLFAKKILEIFFAQQKWFVLSQENKDSDLITNMNILIDKEKSSLIYDINYPIQEIDTLIFQLKLDQEQETEDFGLDINFELINYALVESRYKNFQEKVKSIQEEINENNNNIIKLIREKGRFLSRNRILKWLFTSYIPIKHHQEVLDKEITEEVNKVTFLNVNSVSDYKRYLEKSNNLFDKLEEIYTEIKNESESVNTQLLEF